MVFAFYKKTNICVKKYVSSKNKKWIFACPDLCFSGLKLLSRDTWVQKYQGLSERTMRCLEPERSASTPESQLTPDKKKKKKKNG